MRASVCSSALPVEPYVENRIAGSLIVVDPATNRTSGALLVSQGH